MNNRINALEPLCKSKTLWVHRHMKQFTEEFENYPGGTMNTLDVLGWWPQLMDLSYSSGIADFMRKQQESFESRMG